MSPPHLKLQLSLVLLSASLIAFQLELIQVLAHIQFYHFGYLVISIALLGFGASGTVIVLFRRRLIKHFNTLLPVLFFGCSMAMSLALPVSGKLIQSFDLSLLFIEPSQFVILLFCQLLFFVVFFFGALAIGLIFIHYSTNISTLYFGNMIGSGLGGLGIVFLMSFILPERLAQIIALLPWFGGWLLYIKNKPFTTAFGLLNCCIIAFLLLFPNHIQPSLYKSIRRTLDLPDSRVISTQSSPLGTLQIVQASALRYSPGLSLAYDKTVPPVNGFVFLGGDGLGPIYSEDTSFMRATIGELPFQIKKPKTVLSLSSATGSELHRILSHHPLRVNAIEANGRLLDLLSRFSNTAHPYNNPNVQTHVLHPRTWLAIDSNQYDLVTMPTVGSFGGSAGLFAMQEHFLLTAEAFSQIWDRLSPNGLFQISAWIDSPLRTPLRLTATIAELFEQKGVHYQDHLAAVRSWDMLSLLIKRSPFTTDEIDNLAAFSRKYQFDLILPKNPAPGQFYHSSDEDSLVYLMQDLFDGAKRTRLYGDYGFNIRPVTDQRPFFSQFLRFDTFNKLISLFGRQSLPFLELGYFIVILSLIQMVVLSIGFIVIPLFKLDSTRMFTGDWSTLIYFAGLGVGYMFFEIALIHELVLFLGHPIYGAAAGIGFLLVFSGLGSLYSERFHRFPSSNLIIAACVAILLLLYSHLLTPILQNTIGIPLGLKAGLCCLLVGLPAFVMGMVFPIGLRRIANRNASVAAWAWGMNGCSSVIATGLATIIAVELGFSVLLMMGAGCYLLVALCSPQLS